MTYNVGDKLQGKDIVGVMRNYEVTKTTLKTVVFNLTQRGKVVENAIYRSKKMEDGSLEIRLSEYKSLRVFKV